MTLLSVFLWALDQLPGEERGEGGEGGEGEDGGDGRPLYSIKLHIRVRLLRTNCVTSLTILAFSFGERVVNHFARRCGWIQISFKKSSIPKSYPREEEEEEGTHNFALPGQENEISISTGLRYQ